MSTIYGNSYVDVRNLNLKGGAQGMGLIRWSVADNGVTNAGLWASNPFSVLEYGLYVNASGSLVYSALGSPTVLGAAGGGGGGGTWASLFAANNTFTLTGTTWTVDNNTGNNDVLTLTNSGAGSGDVLQFTNAGTGSDVKGTSGSWSVSKAGAAVFLSVASATINGAGAGLTLGDSGANVITIGTNSNTIVLAKAVTFSAGITLTNGLTTFNNTGANANGTIAVVDNASTTLGNGGGTTGIAKISSTSLTTGTLLLLSAAQAALTTGGSYLQIWDSTGAASVFNVAANGATTIAGSAYATPALTLTAGDLVVSSGKLLVTAADNSASMAVFTNNTAAAHTLLAVAGSGTFTGVTTASFVTLTPSGLTSGTALYFPLAAMNTGIGINMPMNALTTGQGVVLSHTTSTIADGGSLLRISSTSADTGGATKGTLLDLSSTIQVAGSLVKLVAGAVTTGILVDLSSTSGLTSGSLIRATSSTAGAIATNGAISFSATGVFTSTSNAGFVNITANSTTAGTVLAVNATGLVDGVAIFAPSAEAGLTSGKYLSLGGVFTVSKFGATVITGTAAGTNALTLTNGDIAVSAGAVKAVGRISSSSPAATGGVGYATGAGGTATQGTNRSTGVTVSPNPSLCGTITTDTTSLATLASAEFTVTNSAVAIGDVVLCSIRSGSSNVAGVAGITQIEVVTVAAGSFIISVMNNSTTTAETGAIIINYVIIKAVAA
jgi:hypothetical protein